MATATPKPPPTIDEGVGIAGKCWIKYRKESTKSLCTPFVVSLAAGDLNLDTFRHYISQDVYFLKAFAQAYARDFFAFFFSFSFLRYVYLAVVSFGCFIESFDFLEMDEKMGLV